MAHISQRPIMNLFSFVKSQIAIFDVISQYATLKKAGLYWKGTCPFHSEKTASFTVSPHREIYYCFGCHSGGDVISFMAKVENCSAIEATKLLIDRYQLTVPASITHELTSVESGQDRKEYYELCKIVATWCHENMIKSPALMSYMQKRGFTKATVSYFMIGYFPSGLAAIKNLLAYAQKHQFLPTDLVQAHILNEGKTTLYSSFEERVIFPIKDHLGRFCGFGGRIYKNADERSKYYNSKESEFFVKGSLLFGLDVAKKQIQEKGHAFLVEGYTDCVAMVQYGYTNTVATLGTACTVEHLKQLTRYCQQLYILYDADNAGEQAIVRLTQLCWQVNLELKVVRLPSKEDPASFLTKGGDLQPLITHAQDIFLFFIDSLSVDFTSKHLSEKITLIRKLIATINTIPDPLARDILFQKAAKTLDIPLETIRNEGNTSLAERRTAVQASQQQSQGWEGVAQDPVPGVVGKLEKTIFCAIINNIELFNNTNEKYLLEYLPNPLRAILEKLQQEKAKNSELTLRVFFDRLTDFEKSTVSKIVLEHEQEITPETFQDLIMQLHKKNWKAIVHTIKEKIELAKNNGNTAEVARMTQDFLELKKTMMKKNTL